MKSRYAFAVLACAAMIAFAAVPALAQGDFDTPTLTLGPTGLAKQTITVTAGATGAPAGFTIWWMPRAEFDANGGQWWLYGDPKQGEANFTGTPSLNRFPGDASSFALGPNESITVEIGDLFDETGVTVTGWRSAWGGELEYGTQYVFCAFANAQGTVYQSGFTENFDATTILTQDCTFTIGYWKNHPEAWPAGCTPMNLGGFSYTAAELMSILNQPVQGNGAISLAHQLIGAKLNICQGANPAAAAACVTAADGLLASCGSKVPPVGSCNLAPGSTSTSTQCLDDYNNGLTGPGHCPSTPARTSTWGQLKVLHR
ncbi:MAG TPA: hypothetical protein VJY35_09710 [Candidatus Eisenbacteria bacterium]|nr:hypothetical protein [Candidatus Eisenbacteria bacterium]